MERRVMEALRAQFKPEFLNRVDDIVIFHSLTMEQIKRIIEIQLNLFRKRLTDQQIEIRLSDSAKELLAERGFDPVYGARPLRRAMQKYLMDPLALKILEGSYGPGSNIVVDAGPDGALTFSASADRAA